MAKRNQFELMLRFIDVYRMVHFVCSKMRATEILINISLVIALQTASLMGMIQIKFQV